MSTSPSPCPRPQPFKKKKINGYPGNYHCSHFTDENIEAQTLNDFIKEIELVSGKSRDFEPSLFCLQGLTT